MEFIDLGLIDYDAAYQRQKEAVDKVLTGEAERIFLCEHPAVLTLGRLADSNYIRYPREELSRRKITVKSIDRGGEVTLHAPGQLVIYPILDLRHYGKDLKRYLFLLEQVAIDLLREFDILASRISGRTGAWAGDKKIASIGIGVKKWVSFHGLAVNLNTDLKLFSLIKPCGLDVQMTSVADLKKTPVNMPQAKNVLKQVFENILKSENCYA